MAIERRREQLRMMNDLLQQPQQPQQQTCVTA
jgi:hypothetical protein